MVHIYRIALLGIATGFFPYAHANDNDALQFQFEGLQSTDTEQWLKWDDQHAWSGIDHFLSAWKGETSDPQPLQEHIFQARSAVMTATANPEGPQNVQMLRKHFSTLCDAFHANTRSDCLSQIMEHKEELCRDTVVADRQNKVCNTLLQRALNAPLVEETPLQPKSRTKTMKRFRLPGF